MHTYSEMTDRISIFQSAANKKLLIKLIWKILTNYVIIFPIFWLKNFVWALCSHKIHPGCGKERDMSYRHGIDTLTLQTSTYKFWIKAMREHVSRTHWPSWWLWVCGKSMEFIATLVKSPLELTPLYLGTMEPHYKNYVVSGMTYISKRGQK